MHPHFLQTGAPSLYVYLTEDQRELFGDYNSWRCAASAHAFCLCNIAPASPSPPPHVTDESQYSYTGTGVPIDASGHAAAFYKLVGHDVAMPSEFTSHTTHFECPAEDTGAAQCGRHCAGSLGDHLVSFAVTGLLAPPPPPLPDHPPEPPSIPPNPLPPWGFQFNGATDGCRTAGLYRGAQCRDGGLGSIYPP